MVARKRGWAPSGEHTYQVPTQQATQKFNVIQAISTLGVVAHMIQEKTITCEDFEYYLENILVSLTYQTFYLVSSVNLKLFLFLGSWYEPLSLNSVV